MTDSDPKPVGADANLSATTMMDSGYGPFTITNEGRDVGHENLYLYEDGSSHFYFAMHFEYSNPLETVFIIRYVSSTKTGFSFIDSFHGRDVAIRSNLRLLFSTRHYIFVSQEREDLTPSVVNFVAAALAE